MRNVVRRRGRCVRIIWIYRVIQARWINPTNGVPTNIAVGIDAANYSQAYSVAEFYPLSRCAILRVEHKITTSTTGIPNSYKSTFEASKIAPSRAYFSATITGILTVQMTASVVCKLLADANSKNLDIHLSVIVPRATTVSPIPILSRNNVTGILRAAQTTPTQLALKSIQATGGANANGLGQEINTSQHQPARIKNGIEYRSTAIRASLSDNYTISSAS